MSSNNAVGGTVFAFVTLLAFFLLNAQPYFLSQNAQVHGALARLYGSGNFFLRDLGVLSHSDFAARFVDQHFLFDLALAPLAIFLPVSTALCLLAACGLGLLAVALLHLLPRAAWPLSAALLFCGLPILDRLYWQRPAPFVLALLLLTLREALRERPRGLPLFFLGFLGFAISFESLLAFPILLAAELWPAENHAENRWRPLAGWSAGTLLSFAMHPYPWARLQSLIVESRQNFLHSSVSEWHASPESLREVGAIAVLVLALASAVGWRKIPVVLWVAFIITLTLALRADRFGAAAFLLGGVILARLTLSTSLRFSRAAQIAATVVLIVVLFMGSRRLQSQLVNSDGHTAGDPLEVVRFLDAKGLSKESILLANLSDWSGLFALDPHTRAEPGFSLALFESAHPGFTRDYNRWISRPNWKHEKALLKHFGTTPPRFLLARREGISNYLPYPELYVPLFFNSQYGLFELATGPAPASVPAFSKLSGNEISAAWKLFHREATTWAWPAEFLCVEGVANGQEPSPGKACWRRREKKAVLVLDERNGADARALKIHLLRALPGNDTAAAALEPGIRGTRALLLPFPLAGTKLFLGDELLFLPPPFSEEFTANWQAALPLSQESYFSPRESEAHPYSLGIILDRPASPGELTAGFELAAAFLARQVGADGELLYHRSLLSAGLDSAGGAEGSVRLNHAAYVLCLSPGAARGESLRKTLLEACHRAVIQRLAASGPLEKQSLGELATIGLALLAHGNPQYQETLAGIETEVLRRFGQGKFQISGVENEVFFPGEAAVFLSLRSSPASQKVLAESIPYYRNLFRSDKQPQYLVRWFGEAMLRFYDRSGNANALAFLEEILRFTEKVQAAAPKLPWMDGCLAGGGGGG
ncbi:MAG: hypothetical protein ACXWSC_20260, partial [Bdellovibrionota bacterium]